VRKNEEVDTLSGERNTKYYSESITFARDIQERYFITAKRNSPRNARVSTFSSQYGTPNSKKGYQIKV
jgi:hypothetical protein